MNHRLFRPVPRETRAPRLEAYRHFLLTRDGTPDYAGEQLPLREQRTRRYQTDTLRYDGPFDELLFREQYRRFDRKKATPRETLLVLACVKINAAEAYGVTAVRKARRRLSAETTEIERIINLEEQYHTRILLSAAVPFGIRIDEPYLPVPVVRALVAGLVHLPPALFHPLVLASEVVGAFMFWKMLSAARTIFGAHGNLRDALEERLMDVLIDELGHVAYNRLLVGEAGTVAARSLVPFLVASTHQATPELDALGLGVTLRDVAAFDVDALPEEVRRQAFCP